MLRWRMTRKSLLGTVSRVARASMGGRQPIGGVTGKNGAVVPVRTGQGNADRLLAVTDSEMVEKPDLGTTDTAAGEAAADQTPRVTKRTVKRMQMLKRTACARSVREETLRCWWLPLVTVG